MLVIRLTRGFPSYHVISCQSDYVPLFYGGNIHLVNGEVQCLTEGLVLVSLQPLLLLTATHTNKVLQEEEEVVTMVTGGPGEGDGIVDGGKEEEEEGGVVMKMPLRQLVRVVKL